MPPLVLLTITIALSFFATPNLSYAQTGSGAQINLTDTWNGVVAIVIFVIAYATVISEEFLHLRKSKPVIVAAGAIWLLVAMAYTAHGDQETAGELARHNILEFGEVMLFLLSAMTYINTMQERNVFNALRGWLVSSGFSLRTIFWLSGILAFFISAVADNLTTALIMGAVVMAVGAGNPAFVSLACINIVVAANAGGAFSPFGDITTLMVWQKGVVQFWEFLDLFIPSVVNWFVPAFLMSLALPKGKPTAIADEFPIKHGGLVVVGLFIATIGITVSFHSFYHLPPALGMMTGLGLLKIFGFYLRKQESSAWESNPVAEFEADAVDPETQKLYKPRQRPFDIYISMKRVEWDTLMFFYGVVLCVGGLAALGYLAVLSETMYTGFGPTQTNIAVGLLSAIVDNIPVMFAVLTMNPDMALGQWLLVTLTAGVGGSLLSIGSAAGVALMGQARGVYTFFAHLKWTWAIALGYAASIWVHLLLNADIMQKPL
ncbi:MAG: NhaD family Na(+)/H(+) antiporter [Gammaproteobacteria bacterium]|nr:MAG: NhaD family Na(+)/H(+) antiporter [Gammaproteobacteria bacterium]TND02139.1 MAG: NhaD family Na(+)/H(+) antiporter [Gammaproteobacteria bacterium]